MGFEPTASGSAECALSAVKIRISALYPISTSGTTCFFSVSAPSPMSAHRAHRIPISAPEDLLYKQHSSY